MVTNLVVNNRKVGVLNGGEIWIYWNGKPTSRAVTDSIAKYLIQEGFLTSEKIKVNVEGGICKTAEN